MNGNGEMTRQEDASAENTEEEDCKEEENEGEYGDEDEDEEKEEEEEGDEEVDEDALLAEVSLEGAAKFTLDQGVVKNMLRLTSYAASTKRQPRPVLNSVLFRFKGGRLSVVATDSCRLAIVERELASPGIGEVDLIVPLKTVKKLLETLGDDGEVHISATTTHIAFEYGSHNVTAKLAEGGYPDFRKIIPEASGNGVTLGREPFLSALCRVSPPMDGDSDGDNLSGVVVDLFLTPNRLEILSTDSGGGKIRERMDVEYSGPDATAAFYSGHLTDALDHLATDEIDLDIGNGTSPGIIRAADGFLYVFAAVRVR